MRILVFYADEILVMGIVYVYGYKNSRVFDFAILLDSRNLRKLSARKNLVFYSNWCEYATFGVLLSSANNRREN